MHVVEIGIDMVTETEVEIGIHQVADALLHILACHVAPCYRHLRCADDVGEVFLFIAERLGYDERDVHVATLPHALCKAVAGGTESAEDMRWELPPEH